VRLTTATPPITRQRRRPGGEQRWEVRRQDCLDALSALAAGSVDAVITDPPYGINFRGLAWDRPSTSETAPKRGTASADGGYQAWCERWARECLRVLRPGGHLVSFGAARTAHRLASGIEDAGFELRDLLLWLYGQGFPKSKNLAGPWSGWGTTLKPGYEPILLTRKPLAGRLEDNVARHRTGALHIDACRLAPTEPRIGPPGGRTGRARADHPTGEPPAPTPADVGGRWPTNLLLGHAPGCSPGRCTVECPIGALGARARFFYCAKTDRRERDAGCEHLRPRTTQTFAIGREAELKATAHPVANHHPTVKPLELMRWLLRLVTPPDGLIVDPFCGSGSTGCAAVLEGRRFLGIERDPAYAAIARARIQHWAGGQAEPPSPAPTGTAKASL